MLSSVGLGTGLHTFLLYLGNGNIAFFLNLVLTYVVLDEIFSLERNTSRDGLHFLILF